MDRFAPVTRDNAAQVLYNALLVTPKVVDGQYVDANGQYKWVLVDDTREDGAPATLLYRRFGVDWVGDLPAQPGYESVPEGTQ